MNLASKLAARAEAGNPVRVGLIGAGKFGSMILAQARLTPGIQIMGIADLDPERARQACRRTGWADAQVAAQDFETARQDGGTHITDDAEKLIKVDGLDIVVEATGHPPAGIAFALQAIEHGRHLVMVNVEADVVAGPLLAQKARQAGLVYSMAYGDQPALICEQVDWARACGFEIACAGRGVKYLPEFHASTPETVWNYFYVGAELAERGGMNPKMCNSFIDGSKPSIETTAVCNATGLTPQSEGLRFPPGSRFELADICKPESAGGQLEHSGTVEAVTSLRRDGTAVEHDIALGVFVVVEADNDYVSNCFEEYHLMYDSTSRYSALYRPTHLIGLELGISLASIGVRGEPTGTPIGFQADVVATAKRDLKAGEMLDGEGGYCVWGKQFPAQRSLEMGGLPLGLAHDVKLLGDVAEGAQVTWRDVEIDENDLAVRTRREMEAEFGGGDGGKRT